MQVNDITRVDNSAGARTLSKGLKGRSSCTDCPVRGKQHKLHCPPSFRAEGCLSQLMTPVTLHTISNASPVKTAEGIIGEGSNLLCNVYIRGHLEVRILICISCKISFHRIESTREYLQFHGCMDFLPHDYISEAVNLLHTFEDLPHTWEHSVR